MILCGDCLDILPTIEDNLVNLIYTDPPYFKVKNEAWDRQWDTPDRFLAWLGDVLEEFRRVLAPNGSLYLFASPKMAARVELKVGEYFRVLNRIVWNKLQDYLAGDVRNTPFKTHKLEDKRTYLPAYESVIFAEHFGADSQAKGESGYGARCDELQGFVFEPLRAYLDGEKARAGFTTRQVAERFQKKTGSRTVTGMAGHWFTSVQWTLPTEENYLWLQELFNRDRPGEYLRREYEDLRREYEDLRREYEDLRRPFTVSAEVPYTDVWNYETVRPYPGKHPTEKPFQMHIDVINASSRPGDTVLDAFGGSCKVYDACLELGRVPIVIEKDETYYQKAMARIKNKPVTLEEALFISPAEPQITLETFMKASDES